MLFGKSGYSLILGSSLVCDKCGYEKYPSPEYASCEQADQFLDAAVKLDGTPPFPATHNAFQACELYLRELGGFYYYIDESDEGEFQSPSNKHSLSNLRNRLLKPRRDRLDAKHFDGQNFLVLLQKLPDGLWQFLRYREPVLVFPHVAENPEPSIGEDGRLLVNGTDVYEVLIRAMSEFPKWRKYLISLSLRGQSSVRPVQVGGFDVNIVIHRSTAVRGRGGPARHDAWPPSLGAILAHTDGPCGS